MAAVTDTTQPRIESEEDWPEEQRVTPLELFFDLVFVFAFTQVTALMSDNPTWEGIGQGLLVLTVVWWAWGAYSWLTNEIDPDEDAARLAVFAVMGAMLIAALAVPGAFGDNAALFAAAYFVVRVLHIVVFAYASPNVSITLAVRRLAVTAIPAPALLIVAGLFDGAAQALIWCAALAIDFGGVYVFGVEGFQVSPGHFAERYGLIIIIALGESIVAIGIGAAGIPLDAGVVAAALAGIVIAAALWWGYFDVVAPVAERKLREAQGAARARLARDSYSVLHLPMIAGVVLLALGIKKALEHVEQPLDTVPAVALCGGVALYLLAHIAFRLRNVQSLNRQRLATAAACLAFIPIATRIDAVAAVAAIAGICTLLVAYETLRFREARTRVRAARA
ncbi:MAG TPA: low temperature requirement protein A [Solirubrobacterales bacterium]|nr:low temperature requirement protein A [Solirubrobacterales bacterium]